jgi:hypothetical protein
MSWLGLRFAHPTCQSFDLFSSGLWLSLLSPVEIKESEAKDQAIPNHKPFAGCVGCLLCFG